MKARHIALIVIVGILFGFAGFYAGKFIGDAERCAGQAGERTSAADTG